MNSFKNKKKKKSLFLSSYHACKCYEAEILFSNFCLLSFGIHVGNLSYSDDALNVEKHLLQDMMQSVKPALEQLIDSGTYNVHCRYKSVLE